MALGSPWLARARSFVLGLIVWGSEQPANGAPPLEVLLWDQGSPMLTRKIHAELLYAGFAVLDTKPVAAPAGDAELLSSAHAVAMIRVSSNESVNVTVRGTGEAGLYSQLVQQQTSDTQSFALRVVEQLHARLVDLGLERAIPLAKAGEPLGVSEATGATTPLGPVPASPLGKATLWLSGGVGATLAAGGLGLTPQGLLGVRIEPGGRWGAGLFALLPLLDNEVIAAEGEADVSVNAFGLHVAYSQPLAHQWLGTAGVGGGLLVLPLQGDASEPFIARGDRLFAGLYYLELGVGRELSDWLRLRVRLLAGVGSPRPVLRFDGSEVASWGPGFGTLAIGGEVGLPLAQQAAP